MAKKNFDKQFQELEETNPALDLLSGARKKGYEGKKAKNNIDDISSSNQYKLEYKKRKKPETRSKDYHILMKPSLFSRIQAKAKEEEDSINEVINNILEMAFPEE